MEEGIDWMDVGLMDFWRIGGYGWKVGRWVDEERGRGGKREKEKESM